MRLNNSSKTTLIILVVLACWILPGLAIIGMFATRACYLVFAAILQYGLVDWWQSFGGSPTFTFYNTIPRVNLYLTFIGTPLLVLFSCTCFGVLVLKKPVALLYHVFMMLFSCANVLLVLPFLSIVCCYVLVTKSNSIAVNCACSCILLVLQMASIGMTLITFGGGVVTFFWDMHFEIMVLHYELIPILIINVVTTALVIVFMRWFVWNSCCNESGIAGTRAELLFIIQTQMPGNEERQVLIVTTQ